MKSKISILVVAALYLGVNGTALAETKNTLDRINKTTLTETKSTLDRSVQVYKKADLITWNREKAAGGEGSLLGDFAYTRNHTDSRDAFQEIGWLTLPKGASIGLHKHTDNEDSYIIISGQGLFIDGNGKQTPVEAGDITIARPGQSHALKNIGEQPLVFINVVAKLADISVK